MNDSMRLAATVIIWIAFTLMMALIAAAVIITGTIIEGPMAVVILAIMLMLTVAVTSSTRAIWQSSAQAERPGGSRVRAKQKHRDPRRIERLIEDLDDDDVYDLEALLLAREQESDQHHSIR